MTAGHRRRARRRSRRAAPTCRSACRSRSSTTCVVGDDAVGARPQARRGLRALARARPRRRLRRRAELRAHAYDADGRCRPRRRSRQRDGHARSSPLAGAAPSRTPTRRAGCRCSSPSTAWHAATTAARRLHRAVPARPARRDRGRRAGARATALDADGQLRVDLRLHQLGLHAVDRETFERTPKPSAGVYAAIARSKGIGP